MAPHLLHVAHITADPGKKVPIGLWMHRGCVPFISPPQFEKFYWPTLKWIIEELAKMGHQVLFYAEGEWNPNLKYIAELPDLSIIYHVAGDGGYIMDASAIMQDDTKAENLRAMTEFTREYGVY